MARARRWATVAGALAAAALVGLPGCSLRDRAVTVVGHDRNGTLVVGAAACDATSIEHPIALRAVDRRDPGSGADLWSVRRALGDDVIDSEPPPPPPEPDPTHLAGVEMVGVGDPDPPGYTVLEPLRQPLPPRLTVESRVDEDVDRRTQAIEVERDGEPDTYQVARGGARVLRGLDARAAAEAVESYCEDDGSDPLTAAVVVGLVATGVMVAVAGIAIALGVRQHARAGETAATAAGRKG